VKFGSENRKQLIAASVLGAIALIQVVRMAWPSAPPPSSEASASTTLNTTTSSSTPKTPGTATLKLADMSLDPTLRLQLLHAVEGITYGGSGRNIFVEQPDAPPPMPTPVAPPVDLGPPQPVIIPPPPITLKFFGFSTKPGEPKRAFLAQGDDVFIASEGDIVNRRYKVVHINPSSAEIEDVLFNHSQSIPLTQTP